MTSIFADELIITILWDSCHQDYQKAGHWNQSSQLTTTLYTTASYTLLPRLLPVIAISILILFNIKHIIDILHFILLQYTMIIISAEVLVLLPRPRPRPLRFLAPLDWQVLLLSLVTKTALIQLPSFLFWLQILWIRL